MEVWDTGGGGNVTFVTAKWLGHGNIRQGPPLERYRCNEVSLHRTNTVERKCLCFVLES